MENTALLAESANSTLEDPVRAAAMENTAFLAESANSTLRKRAVEESMLRNENVAKWRGCKIKNLKSANRVALAWGKVFEAEVDGVMAEMGGMMRATKQFVSRMRSVIARLETGESVRNTDEWNFDVPGDGELEVWKRLTELHRIRTEMYTYSTFMLTYVEDKKRRARAEEEAVAKRARSATSE